MQTNTYILGTNLKQITIHRKVFKIIHQQKLS